MLIVQLDSEQLTDLIQNAVRKVITETPHTQTLPEQNQLLTVQAAAEFLSLSVPTIYGLISKRRIPYMKRSKRCYFSKEDLLNYLKAGRNKTIQETAQAANDYLTIKAK